MKSFFLRILIAAVFVLALFGILPPFLHVIGFAMSADVFAIFRIVVAVCALAYVVWGPAVPWPPAG